MREINYYTSGRSETLIHHLQPALCRLAREKERVRGGGGGGGGGQFVIWPRAVCSDNNNTLPFNLMELMETGKLILVNFTFCAV